MNRPVPISHDRRSAHPRPPTLRHETDSSSASDFDEHSTFSPSFTSINSRSHSSSSHGSGNNHDRLTGRPISLPLPTLEPSLGYPQPQLLSPGEYLNPMSIAAALARTAADLPPQSSAQAASGAAAGNKTGIGMGTNNGSGDGQHQSSTGGVGGGSSSSSSISGHHRSHSAGSHRRDGDQRTPPPMSDEETRGIVEQLRAMGQSLHEASRAQRRLVDETMHKWNTGSDNGK